MKLELNVPPVVVMFFVSLIMWLISVIVPEVSFATKYSYIAQILFVLTGMFFIIAGIVSFRKAGTTVNPMKPETVSLLITSSVYKFTRNPMYLGALFLLIGWGLFLSNILSCLASILFVLYMNHYQIKPEEKALMSKFGEEYSCYINQVRRWF